MYAPFFITIFEIYRLIQGAKNGILPPPLCMYVPYHNGNPESTIHRPTEVGGVPPAANVVGSPEHVTGVGPRGVRTFLYYHF